MKTLETAHHVVSNSPRTLSPPSLACVLLVGAWLGGLVAAPADADQPPAQPPDQPAAESMATAESDTELAALEQQVRDAETAFAAAFAAGDMEAFASFLHDDAVFMGRSNPLRGKRAIVERWTRMRGKAEAPFSWRPERVAVTDGQFGMSTGPVSSPDGVWTSSYVSTWKKTPEGWRVILDVGPRCPPRLPESSKTED